MVFSSRVLALMLAVGISLVTGLTLYFFEGIEGPALLTAALIVFAVTYIMSLVTLEVVVFREVRKIRKALNRIKKKGLGTRKKKAPVLNPLAAINDEIFNYADSTQREIDDLRRLEAFRREFIADVSHELKTPIFAAQGFLHTLLDGAIDDKSVRTRFLKKAARSLDGLDRLVQDLLVLSQIETGQIKMKPGKVDLQELATEILDQFERQAEKRSIKLRVETDGTRPLVRADEQRIEQVLNNLVSNAINHSFDGGEVIIRFSSGKKNVTTRVIDFGEGIQLEHQPRIFERFYRVDKSRSREKGGTGLGLAIVKHILEGHDSKVSVESVPGKGSVFSFRLPKHKGE